MLRWGQHVIGRPFAIVSWRDGLLEVWIRRLGAGTEELFQEASTGMPVWVTGPLGRGFEDRDLKAGAFVFVSGGVGGASLLPIIQRRREMGHSDFWIHGERTLSSFDRSLEPSVLCLDQSPEMAPEGRKIFSGNVVSYLESHLDLVHQRMATRILACGPSKMLESLSNFQLGSSEIQNIPLWLGLEEKMGCGVGLCFSCSVSTQSGMKRCCLEGPWFEARDIPDHFEFRKGTQSS